MSDINHRLYKNRGLFLYILLSSLFIAFLIVCNLIANKFISIHLFFRDEPFLISCGVLPYPLTFLITDLLSEFFGRKKTNVVVLSGLIASVFIIFLLQLAASFPAWEASPVNDLNFNAVFGSSWRVIGASMLAYISAQSLDVKIYHFWKKRTKGKKLWLRNNASTIVSQFLDTLLVVSVLFLGTDKSSEIPRMIYDGWLFKLFFAICDTPLIYLGVYCIRKYLKLGVGEEFNFNKN